MFSRSIPFFISIILVVSFSAGCSLNKEQAAANNSPAARTELIISAAASLTDALKEIQKAYEGNHTNIKLNFNFGASGTLAQQIIQGAPVDLFLSASTVHMKSLVDQQFIDASHQRNLLMNELVVIIPADRKVTVHKNEDLAKEEIKHVAIGIPETVPAGTYAKEALLHGNMWGPLQSRIVQGKDVRQVLTYVATGNAEAGFVYKTDALTSKKVTIAFHVDPQTYTTVEYPVGIIKATKHSKEALDFYTYLRSEEAQAVFVKFGFSNSE